MRLSKYTLILLAGVLALLASCDLREDPGPLQYSEQPYAITNFDRVDIGDAMYVTIVRSESFSVEVKGDRRNLDDLEVSKTGNTLITRFRTNRNRQHTTYITISMPELKSANFYGATTSSISGFQNEEFTLNLSGASVAQIDMEAVTTKVNLSGASNLTLSGNTAAMSADLSGASLLKSYSMEAEDISIVASGASHAYVNASHSLSAEASGASSIFYRGDATVNSKVSGASSIIKD